MSKRWMMVSSIGQGVLFSLALTGAVRLACLLVGLELSGDVAGDLFLISSLLTGSLSAYLYSRSLKNSRLKPSGPAKIGQGT